MSEIKKVWVMKPDGSLGCGEGTTQSLEDGAQPLQQENIKIYESKKTTDGLMHIQMCGAPTGAVNAYLVAESDLARSKELGFSILN